MRQAIKASFYSVRTDPFFATEDNTDSGLNPADSYE